MASNCSSTAKSDPQPHARFRDLFSRIASDLGGMEHL